MTLFSQAPTPRYVEQQLVSVSQMCYQRRLTSIV